MHDKLQLFIGNWIEEATDEDDFEKCEWFDGQKHVYCSWESNINGKPATGRSIISYSNVIDKFTYYGFSSTGRNSYQIGTFSHNKFIFSGVIKKNEQIVNTRTTLIFSEDGNMMEFILEHEENDVWIILEKKNMVKIQ